MHAKQLLISSIAIILIKCYRVLPLVWTVRKVCSPRMHGGAAVQKKDWFSHWEEDCLSGGPDRAETEQGCLCLQGPAHTELPAAGHRRLLRCSDKPGAECTHITFTSVTFTNSHYTHQPCTVLSVSRLLSCNLHVKHHSLFISITEQTCWLCRKDFISFAPLCFEPIRERPIIQTLIAPQLLHNADLSLDPSQTSYLKHQTLTCAKKYE